MDNRGTAEDQLALHELVALYTFAIDRKDWKALESIFAEDMNYYRGFMSRAAYEKMEPDFTATTVAQTIEFHSTFIDPLQQTYHMTGNSRAKVSGDSGDVSFYLRAHHQGAENKADMFEESLSFVRLGTIRTPAGWRIREMDYAVYVILGTMEVFDTPEVHALMEKIGKK